MTNRDCSIIFSKCFKKFK